VKNADEAFKVLGMTRLGKEGVRAEGVSAIDTPDILQSAENDRQQAFNGQFSAHPFENREAVAIRHVKIEKKNSWKGKSGSIGIEAIAIQVSNGLLA
jgi:hypothetical protein